MARFLAALPIAIAVGAACTAPSVNGLIFACQSDADCAGGKVCATVSGARGCVEKGADAGGGGDIRIGMSAAFTGTSANLGTEMRRGVEAYLKSANANGGVQGGRRVVLEALDDHYDPATAVANTEQLLDMPTAALLADGGPPSTPAKAGPKGVFAIFGNVGTPTMVPTFPIITNAHVVFFAPFTGSQKFLRDGTHSPYSFNFRAGYFDETAAMLDYLFTTRAPQVAGYEHIMVFAQNDAYGDAGYNGLVNAYKAAGRQPALPTDTSICRVGYTRDDLSSVPAAVTNATTAAAGGAGSGVPYNLESIFLAAKAANTTATVAIVMVDTYAIGAQFIKGIKDYLNGDVAHASTLDVVFIHLSFVGPDSLSQALAGGTYKSVIDKSTKSYAEGVMVTQVVPSYSAQSAGIVQYRNDMKAFDQGAFNSTSLEGYLAAALFVKGLKQTPSLDSDALVKTFEESVQNVDLGTGVLVGFSPTDHQASHFVWLSQMDQNAAYSFPYRWDPTKKIQPN